MEKLMLSVQHCMNPLHLYCRLMNAGFRKRWAMGMTRHYESSVYKKILPLTTAMITVCKLKRQKGAHLRRAMLSRLNCLFMLF